MTLSALGMVKTEKTKPSRRIAAPVSEFRCCDAVLIFRQLKNVWLVAVWAPTRVHKTEANLAKGRQRCVLQSRLLTFELIVFVQFFGGPMTDGLAVPAPFDTLRSPTVLLFSTVSG